MKYSEIKTLTDFRNYNNEKAKRYGSYPNKPTIWFELHPASKRKAKFNTIFFGSFW